MATTTFPMFQAGGQVPYGTQANNINQFMTGQAISPFVANLPGYANMVGQRSENTQQMLEGQLPQDVIGQITQGAAERGISGGGGPQSPNSNAAFLRALGLSSLDMMGQGSQQLSQSIADTPTPELFNPASLWVPSTLAAQELQYAQAGQRQQQNQVDRERAALNWNNNRSSGMNWDFTGGGVFTRM